eukprot:TRINITY_DN17271_c0_g1_i1.p1 TRINITY_DN17271_c0_g1~~TRINITY_DN17271_c0_g1_i1.p1  ORF type:complete len:476 (-),score=156.51 TRINITY_DN17271_c0_g1_i1:165-1592(-)
MVKKETIQDVEKRKDDVEQQLRSIQTELRTKEQEILDLRVDQSRVTGELNSARSRRQAANAAKEQISNELKALGRDRASLLAELAELDSATQAEASTHEAMQSGNDELLRVAGCLQDVRNELAALDSPNVMQAALECAGEELPVSLVCAPVAPLAQATASPFKTEAMAAVLAPDGSRRQSGSSEVATELRAVLQATQVIAALQRSLCVRAAELREDLRQLGFARSATLRTEALSEGLGSARREADVEVSQLAAERERLVQERLADEESLHKLRGEFEALSAEHAALQESLRLEQEEVGELQLQRERCVAAADESARDLDRLRFEHDEVGRLADLKSAQLQSFPVEVASREAAAAKLVAQAEDQSRRAEQQLAQTEQELCSVQDAFATLRSVHDNAGSEFEQRRQAFQMLRDEHDQLNSDLNALARHYLALVPPIPGLNAPLHDGDSPTAGLPGAPLALAGGASTSLMPAAAVAVG